MAGLNSLSNLLLVALLGLWAAEGLLLQKQRPVLLPDDGTRDSSEAADYFREELEQHVLGESSRPRTTTPYPDEMLVSSTTETSMPFGDREIVSGSSIGPDGKKGSEESLSVHPANYVKGNVKRTSECDLDLHDIMPLALRTLSHSTGVMVTQRREKRSAIPTSTVRLYQTGGRTRRACNSGDLSKPIFNAGCGDHYLFPGYNAMLVQDEKNCSWRFRHSAPEVVVTLNGVKRNHGMKMYIENANVPTGLMKKNEHSYSRSRRHSFRDLKLSLPIDVQTEGISVEVCVPASPENEKYAEYEAHEWECCDRVPNPNCGLPMGSLDDFSIGTMPWEMVLAVTVKNATNPGFYVSSYCSGSLISADWLLTTASCVLSPEKNNPGSIPFITASFAVDQHVTHDIEEFIIYPTATEDHDIALVRLAKEVRQRPVCLPGYSKPGVNADVVGKVGTVIGWVLDDADHPYLTSLQQRVVDSEECSLQQGKKLPPHMLCTVDSTHGKPCLADGDLLMGTDRFTLRGLSSPRLTCKNDYRPHTSVAHFMPWISNVTGIVMPF